MFPGLSAIWRAGSGVYRALGRLDAVMGVGNFDEAATFVERATRDEPLEELQYWGHGRFGCVLVDRERLDASSLRPGSTTQGSRLVSVLRERLAQGPRAQVWFRTCEAFGAHVGQDFAVRLADTLGVRVCGHTHVIGFWQSGLHGLEPGARPTWSPSEGVEQGTAEAPVKGIWSTPLAPFTIHALEGKVPPPYIDRAPR